MKIFLSVIFALCLTLNSYSQEAPSKYDTEGFQYMDLKEDFLLLVDMSLINPNCATKAESFYSLIIGTAIVDNYIERITVLVPCLKEELGKGELVFVHPIKTPKGKIIYALRTYLKGDEEVTELFGSEFRTTWGEILEIL